jgi:agmatinase
VDLLDRETGRPYEAGIAMLPIPDEVRRWSDEARAAAAPVIEAGGSDGSAAHAQAIATVDGLGNRMNQWVYERAKSLTDAGKLVGLVGGDHSVPHGAIRAASEAHPGLGVLHLDAHCDLREAYEGFRWSHASIMFNVLRDLPAVAKLVQVGIRDYSDEEGAFVEAHADRVGVFFDPDLRRQLFEGETWKRITNRIVAALPKDVYLSFDIDGLDPALCPNTGTPVLGGLSFPELSFLMRAVVESGRRIVGFDLCEVAPDPAGGEWDGNVGARVLYKQIGYALMSRRATT